MVLEHLAELLIPVALSGFSAYVGVKVALAELMVRVKIVEQVAGRAHDRIDGIMGVCK